MTQWGSGQWGSGSWGEYDKIAGAVEASELIPWDAKIAIKDFLKESFGEHWSHVPEIKNVSPPPELMEYWQVVMDIVTYFSNLT